MRTKPPRAPRTTAVVSGLVLALGVPGCGSGDPDRTPTGDAITLQEGLPTQVDGTRVVAYNITDDGAGLQTPDGRVSVDLDGTLDLDGRSYTVAETVPHSDEREGTRPNGWVSLQRQ